jgi:hypothetical protein
MSSEGRRSVSRCLNIGTRIDSAGSTCGVKASTILCAAPARTKLGLLAHLGRRPLDAALTLEGPQ